MTSVFIRGQKKRIRKHQEKVCEDGDRDWSYAVTAKQPLETPKPGRGRKDSPVEVLDGGGGPANPLISDFWLQNFERINFCCFQP